VNVRTSVSKILGNMLKVENKVAEQQTEAVEAIKCDSTSTRTQAPSWIARMA